MKKSCIEILAAEPSTICAGGKSKSSANCFRALDDILSSNHISFIAGGMREAGQKESGWEKEQKLLTKFASRGKKRERNNVSCLKKFVPIASFYGTYLQRNCQNTGLSYQY